MLRKALCLVSLLALAQSAQAFEMLGLQPGASRDDVARVLSPMFPAESGLKPLDGKNTRFFNVSAYSAKCASKSCLAQFSEQQADTRRTVRSESVSAEFSRKDRLVKLSLERMSLPAQGSCQAETDAIAAAATSKHGKPEQQSATKRGGIEYKQLHWGKCAAQGECFALETSCGKNGEVKVTESLTNYEISRQDR